jgi:hypothetical protein
MGPGPRFPSFAPDDSAGGLRPDYNLYAITPEAVTGTETPMDE